MTLNSPLNSTFKSFHPLTIVPSWGLRLLGIFQIWTIAESNAPKHGTWLSCYFNLKKRSLNQSLSDLLPICVLPFFPSWSIWSGFVCISLIWLKAVPMVWCNCHEFPSWNPKDERRLTDIREKNTKGQYRSQPERRRHNLSPILPGVPSERLSA